MKPAVQSGAAVCIPGSTQRPGPSVCPQQKCLSERPGKESSWASHE